MRIIADMHTHTNVTTHAFSSLEEMVQGAKRAGLDAIAITNHGPDMDDGAHQWHFGNLRIVPRIIDGIAVIRGMEANILPPTGGVDRMELKYLERLDYVIASFHDPVYPPANVEAHTIAMENILRNPFVTTLGHPGDPRFAFDYEAIISRCNEFGKAVEINNNSVLVREGSEANCKKIAQLCKKYEVPVFVSSDSHISYTVGKFDNALRLLEEVQYPEELVINADKKRLQKFFIERRGVDVFAG